jgi:hypothetical protein
MRIGILLLVGFVAWGQDAAGIFARMVAAEEAQAAERGRYGYRETQRNWDGKASQPRTKRYELFFVEGLLYRRLVERNGKALEAPETKKQDEAQARTGKERREARKRGGKFLPGTRYMLLGELKDLAKAVEWRIEGEEVVGGRKAWVLAGEPKAGSQTEDSTREIASYQQKFWVDQETNLLAKRWARVIRAGVDLLPGSEVTLEYGSPKEGLPSFELKRRIDFSAKLFGVRTAKGRQEHEYSDFRKYDVESTITFEEPR